MIRRVIRQMLTAQIFSALTVSLCLLIDDIVISRFYHATGMAAYALANPVLLAIGAIGTILATGVQVACSRSLGQGSQEETNAGFSAAVVLGSGISLLFTAVVLLFPDLLATIMGAGPESSLHGDTVAYLRGFSIGALGSVGALVLVPFLQIAGESRILIFAVLGMTVMDVAGDLLSALVFNGGMFGMGLASALSYYVALMIGMIYFLSKRCIYRVNLRQVTRRKVAEILRGGIPSGVTMAASVVLVFALNTILRGLSPNGAVDELAAFTVITAITNAAGCINTGIGGVSLTLTSILFNEEDRTGLRETLRVLARHAVVLGAVVGAAMAILAPQAVSVFVPDTGEHNAARDMAILGLRLIAAGLVPCCMNNLLRNAYQGTGRVFLTEVIAAMEGAILPAAAAFILSRFFGSTGVWCYYAAGEWLSMALIGAMIYARKHTPPWRGDTGLLLRPDFGVSPENLMEFGIRSAAEAADAAQAVETFCLERGQTPRNSRHIALCVEETAANVVEHGFSDGKPHHLSVRIQHKGSRWILRFRDDCRAFDPVHYEPPAGTSCLGLRLVRAIADEVRYTCSLNLNNLALYLGKAEGDAPEYVGSAQERGQDTRRIGQ